MHDPQSLVQSRLPHLSSGMLGAQGYVLGLDIGSYGLRAALIGLHDNSYASAHRDPSSATADGWVAEALDLARGLLDAHGVASDRLVRVGAGFAGPVDARRGIVLLSPRMSGWERFPLAEHVQAAFGAVTLVDNDANLIALAEATFGVAHQLQHLVYVHLSSGVGGGLVLDGRLYHGATTTAGEIGHAVVGPVDPVWSREKPGTLEQHVSISGLLRRAAELGLHTTRLEDIFGEHPIARQVVAEAVDLLGVRLSQIVALLDPQAIVLGGIVVRSGGDAFIEAVTQRMHSYLRPPIERSVPVYAAILGAESVAIGGAALALESMRE
jgi:glucokinase